MDQDKLDRIAHFGGPARRLTMNVTEFGAQFVKLDAPAGVQDVAVEHADKAMNWLVAETVGHTAEEMVRTKWDSPLEVMFFSWWHAVRLARCWTTPEAAFVALRPQETVNCEGREYRLDFVVGTLNADLGKDAFDLGMKCQVIGVELDGHEFHERTKAQATYRNQRDRDLQKRNIRMFHYSGSELHRDPVKCVTEVLEAALAEDSRIRIEVWKRRGELLR